MCLMIRTLIISCLFWTGATVYAQKETISIIGVGDIMMGTNYPNTSYLPANNGKDLFSDVEDFLKGDIVFGNLEGCILNSGGTPKSCKDPNSCYVFRMPEYLADNLVNAGFNLMNLANNHANDFGPAGLQNTYSTLNRLNIKSAGLKDVCEYVVFEKDGIRYGFCGFAPNNSAVSINNYQKIREIITHLDSVSDIIIVSFHGGAEGSAHNRVTRKREIFLGEDRGNVYELAHLCVDLGADVVLGHGPHVPRAVELYKDRIIAYSLGNFCTPFRMNIRGISGYAPVLKVNVNRNGEFVSGEILSAIQTDSTGPKKDPGYAAAKEIARLTALDFPETPLNISVEGKITKK